MMPSGGLLTVFPHILRERKAQLALRWISYPQIQACIKAEVARQQPREANTVEPWLLSAGPSKPYLLFGSRLQTSRLIAAA